jgi:hypothetical protein
LTTSVQDLTKALGEASQAVEEESDVALVMVLVGIVVDGAAFIFWLRVTSGRR